eukprot:731455-Pyramimonas_sp.AAC.1
MRMPSRRGWWCKGVRIMIWAFVPTPRPEAETHFGLRRGLQLSMAGMALSSMPRGRDCRQRASTEF